MNGNRSNNEPLDSVELFLVEMKDRLTKLARSGLIDDVVFIGNTSNIYPRVLSQMVDFDAFLFVKTISQNIGRLLEIENFQWLHGLKVLGIDFEMRIIEGAYKPNVTGLDRPLVLAHLGVFTEVSYHMVPKLKRWSWRKYEGVVDKERLARHAPEKPDAKEVVLGRKGLIERRNAIERGIVEMEELSLPGLEVHKLVVTSESANFNECCFSYATTGVRNYCRLLGLAEADLLSNSEFFEWFNSSFGPLPELTELVDLKQSARNSGYYMNVNRSRDLTLAVLNHLIARINVC